MAKFAYKATNKQGKEMFGVIDSETQALAIQDVRNLGLYPTNIREARKSDERRARKKKGGINELYFGGVKWKQVVVITRQLANADAARGLRGLRQHRLYRPHRRLRDARSG